MGSSYLPPDSPTTSTGDTGGNSSPNSATAPSFPSVYGPPLSARSSGVFGQSAVGQAQARNGGHDDDAVDEVSRVISNLGL